MSSQILSSTDYRRNIAGADKYGRRKCSHCEKFRRINVYWKDTDKGLCKECSLSGDNALMYSVRGRQ